ncbi:MAG: trigger factor [Gemmataceae bacterium]
MTDESKQNPQGESTGEASSTAVATPPETEGKKLRQEVEIRDIGPCKKHIKVKIDRKDIDSRMGDQFSRLVKESNVTGFRPGKAPRKLIEKKFHEEVAEQVKSEMLLASLEQMGEDHDLAPLAPPAINPDKIEIPREGPMVYEFEVEVRPQFDLPAYKGMKLKKPVRAIMQEDVAESRRRFLSDYGQVVPKEGGKAENGDIVVADMVVRHGDAVIGTIKDGSFRMERTLAFKDGLIRDFSKQMEGVKIGDARTMDVQLATNAANNMGGKVVKATLEVKDLKTIRLPELTPQFMEEQFGMPSAEALDELIRTALKRNFEREQRRSAREQVIQQISESAKWELPQDLLERQFNRARARRVMEMRSDGIPESEIIRRIRLMDQDIHVSTAMALKEHFVLQKIAEVEKIDVSEKDMEEEIYRIADQTDESPRRVRARLEKEDMLEALMAEMIERKALDLILDTAEYEEVSMVPNLEETEIATVDVQAVPGEMRDVAGEAEEAAVAKEETKE